MPVLSSTSVIRSMSVSANLLRSLLLFTLLVTPLAHAKKDRDRNVDYSEANVERAQEQAVRDRKARKQERVQQVESAPAPAPYVEPRRQRSERLPPARPPSEEAPPRVYRRAPEERPVAPPYAAPAPRYEERMPDMSPDMSLDQAVSKARRQTRGRVLSADSFDEEGQIVHRVKMLTPDGRVRTLYFDEPGGGS